MKKRIKAVICLVGAIFLISSVLAYASMQPSEADRIEIIQDGEVLYTMNLSDEENRTFTIISADGSSYNTVTISDGQICISDAGCSDRICMKTGVLRTGIPIVCLPNKLIIRFCEE